MHCTFVIHSSTEGHLALFYILAVVNATVNMGMHTSYHVSVLFSLDKYPEVEFPDHLVHLFYIRYPQGSITAATTNTLCV